MTPIAMPIAASADRVFDRERFRIARDSTGSRSASDLGDMLRCVRGVADSAVDEFDTVCVGATRSTSLSQALFGSIPEDIGQTHDGTVAIARGGDTSPRTIREAIVDRLSGEDR